MGETARLEDRALLRAWRDGDRDAGSTLVERHFETVHRFFRLKIDTDVDDLIQRTFLGALESVDRFRGDAAFRTFLLSIARNQLLLHFRERARANRRDVEEMSALELGADASPSLLAVNRQEQKLLLSALRQLPLQLQLTVELLYWEQLSVAEAAEVLDIPAGTVKSRAARARDMLRARIAASGVSDALKTRTTRALDRWAADLRARFGREDGQ